MASDKRHQILAVLCIVAASALAGCATTSGKGSSSRSARHLSERECLVRVMYFESNRSSADGMLAVGTVVMNRRDSGRYPRSICGVVGQKNQFADGALWKSMGKGEALAEQVADRVLAGRRHPAVGTAMFFHTYGYRYPYKNMHYLTVAGGNAFYEKRTPGTFTPNYPGPERSKKKPVFDAPVYAEAPLPPPVRVAAYRPVIAADDRTRLSMFLETGNGLN